VAFSFIGNILDIFVGIENECFTNSIYREIVTLYKNKYRVETTRLPNWDYASDGRYFITICTKNRESFFGKIDKGKMILNEYGRIVEQCWFDLINHYRNLQLDAFVIMPNHMHGIMIVDNSVVMVVETGFKTVSTTTQPQPHHGIFEFVRALKTFSSRRMNELDNTAGRTRWQSRFHDHIIRDEQEFDRIQQYILNNPSTWENDSLNF
jgi:putative transposase